MAIALTAGTVRYRLTIVYQDADQKKYTYTEELLLNGLANEAALVADVVTLMTSVDNLTNAQIISCELESILPYVMSGQKGAPIVASETQVAQKVVFTQVRDNPLRAGKIKTPFIIPAYKYGAGNGVIGTPRHIDESNADVTAVEVFQSAQGAFRYSGDGLIYLQGAYDTTKSGTINTIEALPD